VHPSLSVLALLLIPAVTLFASAPDSGFRFVIFDVRLETLLVDSSSGLPSEWPSSSELVGPVDSSRIDSSQKPVLLVNYLPPRTWKAWALSFFSKSLIEFLIRVDGTVYQARVAKPSGNSQVDTAAIQASRKCVYLPIRDIRGRPVPARVRRWFAYMPDDPPGGARFRASVGVSLRWSADRS
jgi:TonB family protein